MLWSEEKKKKLGSSWFTQLCTKFRTCSTKLRCISDTERVNEAEKGREENNRKGKPKKERKAKVSVIMRAVRSVKKHHQSENLNSPQKRKGKMEREAPEQLQNNK